MESNVVLKYFSPLDRFIKIRRYTAEEVSRLLRSAKISDRRSYVGLVVNACVLRPTAAMLEHEEKLYALAVEVNPILDIHRIAIAEPEEPAPSMYLLEKKPERKDYRRLANLEEELARRIVGQDAAIATVSRAIKKAMTGLRDSARPIAAFLFIGQTGVGKTALAKALTLQLFNDPSRMLRVDGSEYALPHEYAKLIGAPPGYVGHEQGGLLSDLALGEGSRTVLFDEIEKSDRKVHDLLLQAMDEGFVTDNKGARIPFSDTLIILTSNVGTEEAEALGQRIGFGREGASRDALAEEFSRAVKAGFRPEFVNRLTEVVLFRPIGLPECDAIAAMFLEEVRRHAASVPINLRYTKRVPRWLAEKGYRPEYGARELRRTVDAEVEGALSEMLIDGRISDGDTVTIRVTRDRLTFHRN